MEEKKKKVINKIFGAIGGLVLGFLFFVFLITLLVPNGMVKVFGVGIYRVQSSSMDPTIKVNDYVVAKRIKVEDLKSEDIIIFNTKKQMGSLEIVESVVVIHYFDCINEEGYILTYSEKSKDLPSTDENKFDSWGTPDNPYYVTAEDLIGRCSKVIESNESLQSALNIVYSPYLYLGLGLVLIGGTTGIIFYKKQRKKK
jgi:signal peptidase I